MAYRVENKYRCSLAEMACCQQQLKAVMQADPYAPQGGYQVRSLYFDDAWDSMLQDTMNGTDDRVKYRLRLYNGDASFIRLEAKYKKRGLTRKESCVVDEPLARSLAAGEAPAPSGAHPGVLNSFLLAAHTRLLRPKIIVAYTRQALVCPAGNVRVTFDTALAQSVRCEAFFLASPALLPAAREPVQVLEVKYDGALPGEIRKVLEGAGLHTPERESFSKYTVCRTGGRAI